MSLLSCMSRHQCADGGEGECTQHQGHYGRHLCRRCLGFFGGGEAVPAERPDAVDKPGLPGTSALRTRHEGDGVTHWHCAHCGKEIALDSSKCSLCGYKICNGCGENNCPRTSAIRTQGGGLRTMRDCFAAAVKHIACQGDTNIFPQPPEKWVFGESVDFVPVLESIHDGFPEWFSRFPPFYENALTAAGNSGFRTATQFEPVWSAYLLALVLSIGDAIENARVPVSSGVAFSCRFRHDSQTGAMFDGNIGQDRFNAQCAQLAARGGVLLVCDIADCYSSLSHHRLESALHGLPVIPETERRIMNIVRHLAAGESRGLPVGGSAAKLLVELALDSMDKALLARKIAFCRMADDYRIFAGDENEARAILVAFSGLLMRNEGLSLQRNKTHILAAPDFGGGARAVRTPAEVEADKTRPVRDFLSTLWPFAVGNYMENFVPGRAVEPMAVEPDVVARLEREAGKASPNVALLRDLVFETRALGNEGKKRALAVMMNGLPALRAVFPRVMALIRESFDGLDAAQQADVCKKIRDLIDADSHLLRVFCNMGHALRVLGCQPSSENQEACARVYRESGSQMVKRDAILAMAKLGAESRLKELMERCRDMGPWERRALLVASHGLGEHGRRWRNRVAAELTPFDHLCDEWAAARAGRNQPLVPF
jgi:hypothetical protein